MDHASSQPEIPKITSYPSADRLLNRALAQGRISWEQVQSAIQAGGFESLEATGSKTVLRVLIERGELDASELGVDKELLDPGRDLDRPTIPREQQEEDPLWARLEEAFVNWDRYEVLEFIAEGGMGRVYMAHDRRLDRVVALKFLSYFASGSQERFAREARAQAQVVHENVCRIYEVGEFEALPYIAMQYVEDVRLDEIAERLNVDQKVDLIRQVAEGLHAAHRLKLIHRDIKPANILVESLDGGRFHPVIVDFGLAKEEGKAGLTRADQSMGTLGFASPEQLLGQSEQMDHRSDIYSLGVTLYVILTDRLPLGDGNEGGVLGEAVSLRQRNGDLSRDLDKVVMKCLERDPGKRYETAWALAEDLGRYLAGEPVLAERPSWWRRWWSKAKKHPVVSGLAAAGVLGLLLGAGFAWRSHFRTQRVMALAQEFGRESTRIELELRLDRLLPIHDQRNKENWARQELAAIQTQMTQSGAIAQGPGHLALGRGFMALHEYEVARGHLLQALQSGTPNQTVHGLLGLCLLRDFSDRMKDLAFVAKGENYVRRRKELEGLLLEPALSHLREGGRQVMPELSEAILAMLGGQQARAIELAEKVWETIPGTYEAMQLSASVHFDQAQTHVMSGRNAEARTALRSAMEALERARVVARSDQQIDLSMAELHLLMARVEMFSGQNPMNSIQGGLESVSRLRRLDPDDADADLGEAKLQLRLTEYRMHFGGDLLASARESVRLAKRAREKGSESPLTEWIQGLALVYQSADYRQSPDEGMRCAKEAVQVLEAGVARHPKSSDLLNALALSQQRLAFRQMERGEYFLKAADQAVQVTEQALSLEPKNAVLLGNLSQFRAFAMVNAWDNGYEYGWDAEKILDPGRQAIRLNPGHFLMLNNLCASIANVGEILVETGQDPRAYLEEMRQLVPKIRSLNPGFAESSTRFGEASLIEARYVFEQGKDPISSLQRARECALQGLEKDPSATHALIFALDVETLHAEILSRSGRHPGPAIAAFQSLLQRHTQAAIPGMILLDQRRKWTRSLGRYLIGAGLDGEKALRSLESMESGADGAKGSFQNRLFSRIERRLLEARRIHQTRRASWIEEARTLLGEAQSRWPNSITVQRFRRQLEDLKKGVLS